MTALALLVGLCFGLYLGHVCRSREVERLQSRLDYYGQHDPGCDVWWGGDKCNCGWTE